MQGPQKHHSIDFSRKSSRKVIKYDSIVGLNNVSYVTQLVGNAKLVCIFNILVGLSLISHNLIKYQLCYTILTPQISNSYHRDNR